MGKIDDIGEIDDPVEAVGGPSMQNTGLVHSNLKMPDCTMVASPDSALKDFDLGVLCDSDAGNS